MTSCPKLVSQANGTKSKGIKYYVDHARGTIKFMLYRLTLDVCIFNLNQLHFACAKGMECFGLVDLVRRVVLAGIF